MDSGLMARIGQFTGGGIDGPWGIAVDGEDNLWVANFGPLQPGSNFTDGRISELCGINGDPLYGLPPARGGPSFAPMMRQTNVVIDRAGNIWALNNWKPDFDIDLCCNPGGDGVVIFVGLAAPPNSQAP